MTTKAAIRCLLTSRRAVSNIGTRLWSMNSATTTAATLYSGLSITAGTQVTAHAAMEVETDFDAVRVILVNHSTSATQTVVGATACSGASLTTDGLNNTGFSTAPAFTFSGAAGGTVPVATTINSATCDGILMSDWLNLSSVDRADIAGARPALYVRVLFEFAGGGTDVVSFWNRGGSDWTTARTNAFGALMTGHNTGNKLNTTLGGGGAFVAGNTPIFGVQYRARAGRVMTVLIAGDSITAGSSLSTRLMRPWGPQACMSVSSKGRPVEFITVGLPGQQPSLYGQVAAYLMPTLNPTHAMFAPFSPNVMTTTISEANITTMRGSLGTFLDKCRNNKNLGGTHAVSPALWSGVSRNSASAGNTAAYWDATSDNRRKAFLAEFRAMGFPYANANDAICDGASPELIKVTGNGWPTSYVGTDGLHPNDAGDAAIQTAAQVAIQEMADRYFSVGGARY